MKSPEEPILIHGWPHKKGLPFAVSQDRFKKMLFIYNALEEGWTIKKRDQSFVFTKKHEGKKEILSDDFLVSFMKDNFDLKKILT
jgi:hypothetical protein